ncbi:hypothetical protein [Paraburkholderia franconis]
MPRGPGLFFLAERRLPNIGICQSHHFHPAQRHDGGCQRIVTRFSNVTNVSSQQRNKMKKTRSQQYGEYIVHPTAHRLSDGLFSADLMLEAAGEQVSPNRYEFFSLDYFVSEADAVRYARRWACNWIDTRG